MRRSDDDPVSWTIGDSSHATESPRELQPAVGVAPPLGNAVSPERARCPRCGAVGVLPIVYGLPSREMRRAERRGELVLGGCFVRRETRYCRGCSHEWDHRPPRAAGDESTVSWNALVEHQRRERVLSCSGSYSHASGWVFPPVCAGFRRGVVRVHDPDEAELSMRYELRHWLRRPRDLSATVFVYPRVARGAPTRDELLEHLTSLGPDPTMAWSDAELSRQAERLLPGRNPLASTGVVSSEDFVPLRPPGGPLPGLRREYRTPAQPLTVWLVASGAWWIRAYAACSERDAPSARAPLERLLHELCEPSPSAP